MYAFYPAEGQPEVSIAGVGLVSRDGIPLERAAESMSELQRPGLDGDGVVPLEGDELQAAAEEWAARAGLVVRTPAVEPEAEADEAGLAADGDVVNHGIFDGTDALASQPLIPADVLTPAETPGVDTPPQEA